MSLDEKRRKPGRRPDNPDNRSAILTAARAEFAAKGFDKTTIARIAARAGCDPALVHYFFGTKRDLFSAAVELPYDPETLLATFLDRPGRRPGLGAEMVAAFLHLWDPPETRDIVCAILRSATSDDAALTATRDLLTQKAILPAIRGLGCADAQRRAPLLGSQVIGLLLVRYVLRIEPIASDSVETLAAAIGPVVEHYLWDDLAEAEGHVAPVQPR